jgi:trehalose/maltose hydrolase-like predicted phosphorylase
MGKKYKIKGEWEIEESSYTPDENLYFESIFALGNGYGFTRNA